MSNRKAAASVAAIAALACAGWVRAAAPAPVQDAFSLTEPIYAANAPRKPLMHALDQLGVASTLDEYGINIGGHIQAGWTYNFDTPDSGINVGRAFDFENQDPTLHQLDVFIERAIKPSPDKFDVGGFMEWVWGGDARLIHANGIFDHQGYGDGPDEQFDPVQFYLTCNVPVGNGILVTAGKFVTHMNVEAGTAPYLNPFYSHSYLFLLSNPTTFMGVKAAYKIDEQWSVMAGVVRGWNQGFEDVNDRVTFIGRLSYTSELIDAWLNVITGPEKPDNRDDFRTVFDAVVIYRHGDQWIFKLNANYGFEPESGDADVHTGDREDAMWWGAAGYVTYVFDERFQVQGRLEYFADNDGGRGASTQLVEATVGVNIKPMPNDVWGQGLIIRPELRFDYAEEPVFNDGNDDTQWTFGIDAIYVF